MSVHVSVEPEVLDPDYLKSKLNVDGCGSIVSFVGITRGLEEGSEVKRLEFDSWEEKLPVVLESIAMEAMDEFGVCSVVIAHRTGAVLPTEPIVCIHVSSPHRSEGFRACSRIIDELKIQAPLWKKEIRSDGEFWKDGLG